MPVGEHLHLDVPWVLQVAFDQHAVVAERRCGFLPCGIQSNGKLVGVGHDPHAATAAAGHRLDHQWEADAHSLIGEKRDALLLAVIARQHRHAGLVP